jgi:hypothetical protein
MWMTSMVWKSKQERNSIHFSVVKNPKVERMILIKKEIPFNSKEQIHHLAMELIFPYN